MDVARSQMFTSDVMCTSSVSNVIYHKFSHDATFYTLNGKNFNVMLESSLYMLELRTICIFAFIYNVPDKKG